MKINPKNVKKLFNTKKVSNRSLFKSQKTKEEEYRANMVKSMVIPNRNSNKTNMAMAKKLAL